MTERETVFISEADQYLFAKGTHYDIYKKLGAHLLKMEKKECSLQYGLQMQKKSM